MRHNEVQRVLFSRHYHQMNGELALRLIRAIRTDTASTLIDELFLTSNQKPSSSSTLSDTSSSNANTVNLAEDIDIVPYKCSCPYSTSTNGDHCNSSRTQLKMFAKFVKNIPCDRPCPVNLYRHLRNYHKVDLQHAKDITRTIMLAKSTKADDEPSPSEPSKKRVKLPVGQTHRTATGSESRSLSLSVQKSSNQSESNAPSSSTSSSRLPAAETRSHLPRLDHIELKTEAKSRPRPLPDSCSLVAVRVFRRIQ